MKYIRYSIIGLTLGGALGAQIGSYIAKLLEEAAAFDAVKTGIICGAIVGFGLTLLAFLAIASMQSKNNQHEVP